MIGPESAPPFRAENRPLAKGVHLVIIHCEKEWRVIREGYAVLAEGQHPRVPPHSAVPAYGNAVIDNDRAAGGSAVQSIDNA